jgi:hypothetical protein
MAIALTQTAFNPITGVFGTGNVQIFGGTGASTGSYTWTVPPGVAKVRVRLFGGGGGSSSANGGSGGGFAMKTIYDLSGVTSVAVTVGLGGSISVTGGTSSFGSFVSVTGGNAGSAAVAPGTSTSGDINSTGGGGTLGGGGVGNLFGSGGGGGVAGAAAPSAASGGGGTTNIQGGPGLFGSAGTSSAIQTPTSGLLGWFSIDFIGTGGGGGGGQSGVNGGGGGAGTVAGYGGYPGGGSGGGSNTVGGAGMVIVEW